MSKKQKLELTWIGKGDEPVLEPRILIEDLSKSYGDVDSGNMLVHGDNLLALKALEYDFSGKIKCIYIDPPYNTGSAFEHYDDGIEHSVWLNLMYQRLALLKKLLAPDGVIVVQIGYDEMAYLKVIMDEIFGRNNCIGQVAVRMSHSAGMKRRAADSRLIKNTEYILVYYNQSQPVLDPIFEETTEYPVNYYQYIDNIPTSSNIGNYSSLPLRVASVFDDELKALDLKPTNKGLHELYQQSEAFREWVLENRTRIGRKDSNSPVVREDLVPDSIKDNEVVYLEAPEGVYYIGKNSAGNYYQVYTLEDKFQKIETIQGEEVVSKMALTNLVGDWWSDFYKDMSRVDIEGGTKMKTSKKPERLVSWVLKLITKEGDYVLDSFLGSGTTAAVAQKMGRKWIGIELGDHANTLAYPRLCRVIDGKDRTGVTSAFGWSGGGGFKFYELAPSLLGQDKHGNWIISKDYDANMLAHAVAKQEGFTYSPSQTTYWKQGFSTENDFIFTTTQHITVELLDAIHSAMQNGESLLVACKAFDSACKDRYDNITIKKIPHILLGRCEFGKDDYSLNISEPTETDSENTGVEL